MNWYKQSQNMETVYHGGWDIGEEPTISRGYQFSKKNPETGQRQRTGYDSGGVFFTPDLDYAKSYQKDEPGLYQADISTDNIFDASNESHWNKFKEALSISEEYDTAEDALRAYALIKQYVQDSIQEGYPDWATISQFSDEIEEAGFDGMKMLERGSSFMHDKPIPSYALFKNIKSKRHPEQGHFRDPSEMPFFSGEETV